MAASARELFRATGKKSKPVLVRDLISGEIVRVDALEREGNDFYPTPPGPTRAILSAEIDRLRDFGTVWEPAAGDGAMVREMESVGLTVRASDLIDRGCGADIRSFYDFPVAPSKAILTNPPFSECAWGSGKARWLTHALDNLSIEYMALLLPFTFCGAAGLAKLWNRHAPARVHLLRWRIDFTGQGASPATNAWVVWDKAHRGETVLRMLDRSDARQAELFGEAA
jgi:hypothetical protein